MKVPLEFLVHVGEVAVDLIKSLVRNRHRIQGILRLSAKSPDFIMCIRLALVSLFQVAFFPIEDFPALPEVFPPDATSFSCSV